MGASLSQSAWVMGEEGKTRVMIGVALINIHRWDTAHLTVKLKYFEI